jgi:hypothetical protein
MYKVGCITKSVTFFHFSIRSHVKTLSFGCGHLGFPSYTPPPPPPPSPHGKNHPMIIHIQFGSIILFFPVKIIYYLTIKSFVRTLSSGASHLEFLIGTTKFYIWSCIREYSFNVWNQCLSPLSEFKSRWGWGVQHYVIKFVSDLRQVGGFFRFTPPIKLTATI